MEAIPENEVALLLILAGPAGSGKTTLCDRLVDENDHLERVVTCTTRALREGEKDGVDYHFLSAADFAEKVKNGEFVEYEEVYEGLSYGTLCSEVERLWRDGRTPLFDVDVVGGQTLKAVFGESALSIFVMPPSMLALEDRLRSRGTEDEAALEKRIAKSQQEMEAAPAFDLRLVNDDLDLAKQEAEDMVGDFLERAFQ